MFKTTIAAIATVITTCLGLGSIAGATCLPVTHEYVINSGRELPDGVPNYDQDSFQPGRGDCAPVAVAMVLGYWDANGWSLLYERTGPYTGGDTPHPNIDNAVEHLKHSMGYKWPNGGTRHLPGVTDWGPAVKDYVRAQDKGASWTTWDGYVDFNADIKKEVKANRPVVFSLMGVPGKKLTWDSPTGTPDNHKKVKHSLTAIGYRQVVKSSEIWPWGCVDWVNTDDRYVVTRSGWRNGGDSTIYYHWGLWDTKTRLVIRPGGTPEATDWRRSYFFKGSQYSRWDMEPDRIDQNYPLGMSYWRGGVPSNLDAALNLGNGKAYFFKGPYAYRYDLRSDYLDANYPRPISSEFPGVPDDLDAAVPLAEDNGKVLFFKGNQVWTWDIAAGRLESVLTHTISTTFPGLGWTSIDAAVNWGNGRLYLFKDSHYVRFNTATHRVDRGYPKSISGNWSGLFGSSLDAALSYTTQFYAGAIIAKDVEHYYSFDVGTTARTVKVQLSGSADADLYVRRGTRPTETAYECRPYTSDTDETCSLSNVTGRVQIMVKGYEPWSGYQLRATWTD